MCIRNFYKNNPPHSHCITQLKFRHFRFALKNTRFMKLSSKIRDNEQLHAQLVRYRPLDAYYSTARWLNPELVGPREKDDIVSNHFLGCDLAFDIDRKPFGVKKIEQARQDTLALIEELRLRDISPRYVAFSGGKGFHIICDDPFDYVGENPVERETEAVEKRKAFVKELACKGLEFDEKITVDTRRIIRIPGTINSKTGYVCTQVSEDMLARHARDILKSMKRHKVNTPKIPSKGDDLQFHWFRTMLGRRNRNGARSPPKYQSSLSSSIIGLKTQVLITWTALTRRNTLEKYETLLAELQKTYNLSDIIVFRDAGTAYAVCLKCIQRSRLEKIHKASGSKSLNQFRKYGQNFMKVGYSFTEDGHPLDDATAYVKTLPSENDGASVSRAHHMFFKKYGVPLKEPARIAGQDQVKIVHLELE